MSWSGDEQEIEDQESIHGNTSDNVSLRKRRQTIGEEEELIRILKKPYRTLGEIMTVEERTKDLKFFEQINKVPANQKAHLHRRICKYLTLEFLPKGRVVFYEGDEADAFYILLKGRASVLLKKNIQQMQLSGNNPSNSTNPGFANSQGSTANLQSNEQKKQLHSRKSFASINPFSNTPLMKMLRIRLFHRIVWRLINILRFVRYASNQSHKTIKDYSRPMQDVFQQELIEEEEQKTETQIQAESQMQQQQQQQSALPYFIPSSNTEQQQQQQPTISQFVIQSQQQITVSQQPQQLNQQYRSPYSSAPISQTPQSLLHNSQTATSFSQIDKIQNNLTSTVQTQQQQQQQQLLNTSQSSQLPQPQQQASSRSLYFHQSQQQQSLQVQPKDGSGQQLQTRVSQQMIQISQMSQPMIPNQSSIQNIQMSSQILPLFPSSSQQLCGSFGAKSYGYERFQKLRKEIQMNVHPELDILYLENVSRFFHKQQQCFQYSAGKVFEKGDSFGELGLLNKKPRSATIVCLHNCYFASLSKAHYTETLREVEKQHIQKRVDFLRVALLPQQQQSTQLDENANNTNNNNMNYESGDSTPKSGQFQFLPSFLTKLNKMQVSFTKQKFVSGHCVIRQGKTINKIYLIKKGEVNCSMHMQNAQIETAQPEIQLAVFQKYEFVGAEELLLLLQAMRIEKDEKEKAKKIRIENGEELSEDELDDEIYYDDDIAEAIGRKSKKKSQTKFVAAEKITPIAYSTTIVKSQTCSVLAVLVTDFCRFLDDFPEMREYLTRQARLKRNWIDQRLKEQSKLLRHIQRKQNIAPLPIVDDQIVLSLLSPPSVLRRALLVKNASLNSPKVNNRQLKQAAAIGKDKLVKKAQKPDTLKQQKIVEAQEIAPNAGDSAASMKLRKQNDLSRIMENYFEKEMLNVDKWNGGALTQMAAEKEQLTVAVTSDVQHIIEEGLALKYGYIHSLSSKKIKPGQVIDFIFNHQESNKQMAIAETAVEGKLTYCGVISELERGTLELKERPEIVVKKEVQVTQKPVKVDYTTLGYSDELIKRMVSKQSKLKAQQTMKEDDEQAEQAKQAKEQRKKSHHKNNSHRIHHTIFSSQGKNSQTPSHNAQGQDVHKNNNIHIGQVSSMNNSSQANNEIDFKGPPLVRHRSINSSGHLPKKKIYIPLDPEDIKQNIQLNQRILQDTQQLQRSRTMYNPTLAALPSTNYGLFMAPVSTQKHTTLQNSRISKRIYEMIFSKSIFAPPPPPDYPEQGNPHSPSHSPHHTHRQSLHNLNVSPSKSVSPRKQQSTRSLDSSKLINNSFDVCSSPNKFDEIANRNTPEKHIRISVNSLENEQKEPGLQQQLQKEFKFMSEMKLNFDRDEQPQLDLSFQRNNPQSNQQNKELQKQTNNISELAPVIQLPSFQKISEHSQARINQQFSNIIPKLNTNHTYQTGYLVSPSQGSQSIEDSKKSTAKASQFRKTEEENKKKLASILGKFQSAQILENNEVDMEQIQQQSQKKEINIHVNKNKDGYKATHWTSRRFSLSRIDKGRDFPQNENIFHMIASQKEIIPAIKKPPSLSRYPDIVNAPQLFGNIQTSHSLASLQMLESTEKSKKQSADKVIVLNHMGKPIPYFLQPSNVLSSSTSFRQKTASSLSSITLSSQTGQTRKGTSLSCLSKSKQKPAASRLRSPDFPSPISTPKTLLLTGTDFFPSK